MRPIEAPRNQIKFIRKMTDGKYEHGHVILGLQRSLDKYVRQGIVGSYEAAANAAEFEPSVKHTNTSGGTYYENLKHSRDQGNHSKRRA